MVKDAHMKRQCYLGLVISLSFLATVGFVAALFGFCLVLICAASMVLSIGEPGTRSYAAGGTAFFAVGALLSAWIAHRSAMRAARMPYVPPVSRQRAALSPRENLVRASDRPENAPVELLRAATPKLDVAADNCCGPKERGYEPDGQGTGARRREDEAGLRLSEGTGNLASHYWRWRRRPRWHMRESVRSPTT